MNDLSTAGGIYPDVNLSGGCALLIDDDQLVRARLREDLGEGGLFTRFFEADNGLSGFSVLANHADEIDLIVCDVEMPDFDGFKFLQMQHTRDDFAAVPVIILTSREEVSNRIRGLELGAADYLTKPFERAELRLRARHQLKIRRLQEALRDAIRELSHASQTDPLTALPNRRALMRALEHEFQRFDRYGHPLSLVIIDIDDFKRVNDTWGHLVGDDVLVEVARVLQRGLRGTDTAARMGGEEFAILLPETELRAAIAVAERYRMAVERLAFNADGESFGVTISAGVASVPESTTLGIEDLLRKADTALYAAKETGKNLTASA